MNYGYFFLTLSFFIVVVVVVIFCVVSLILLESIAGAVVIVELSDLTVDESVLVVLSALLLQATRVPATANTVNNFFILIV